MEKTENSNCGEDMGLLKKYLQMNGGFSLLSGLIMLLMSKRLAVLFGIGSNIIFLVIGIGLVGFSLFVFYVSQNVGKSKTFVQVITILDILWVVGSLALLVFRPFTITVIGNILIATIMMIIAFFAINQYRNNL